MSDAPHIDYLPRPDATPETEAAALATAYRFLLFDSHDKKKAAEISDGEDHARKELHDSRAEQILRQ